MAACRPDVNVHFNPEYEQSTDMKPWKPGICQNGGLYPKLPTDEHTDKDDSDSSSRDSGDNDVDSGISTGSDNSGKSTSPLLGVGCTEKQPIDETKVNSCRMGPSEIKPLISSCDQWASAQDSKRVRDNDDHYVALDVRVQNGAGEFHKGTSKDDEPPEDHSVKNVDQCGINVDHRGINVDYCGKQLLTKDSFWKKVVLIFSILDILLFITILVVSLSIPTRGPASVNGGDNCLKCQDVYLTEDDRSDNIYNFHMEEGGNLCCSDNQTLLIQKYVVKRYKQDHAQASAERYKQMPKRTAVRVDLDLQHRNSMSEGVNQLLKWSRDDALMGGHLTLNSAGTHIQCTREGLYYINAKVVFRDTKTPTKQSVLLMQVYRSRQGQEMLLLENKSSQCGDADRDCNVPSSTQGVFHLQEHDQVFVRVTKPCGLVLEAKYNYFEVYLV